MLILGGLLAALCALCAGASGFGYALLATPALLLAGFSLPFVVTANLLIVLATRLTVAWRLRRRIDGRRVALLVGGALPGLWLGAHALDAVGEHTLKLAVGAVVAAAAVALAWAGAGSPPRRARTASLCAGFVGGVLGTTTSLSGVPPALLLVRSRLATAAFFADLSAYFVATAAAGLALLAAARAFETDAARAFVWWLPLILVGNALGTTVGLRIPPGALRPVTLGVVFAAGVATVLTA